MTPLGREFYGRDSRTVAQAMLNKVLVRDDGRAARIVEVEAYLGVGDPGSHSFRGMTARTEVMFGPAGHLYVYFTYGMHWCCNAVCGEVGEGTAVLLRAAAPIDGVELMQLARGGAKGIADGPAKLCQAFGIGRDDNGADLVTGDRGLRVVDDGTPPPRRPGNSTRVGLSTGKEHPWRWWVPGDPNVSKGRPS
jgi:DNA-3-methyladenine glycosylase